MEEIMPPLEMIYKSKCWDCVYRLTRLVEPVTQDDLEFYLSMVDIDQNDDYDLIVEQHRCLLTDEDLDGVIRECNQYKPKQQCKLIRDYKY